MCTLEITVDSIAKDVAAKRSLWYFAEHPRILDYGYLPSSYSEYAGYLYNIAYARAMFQGYL